MPFAKDEEGKYNRVTRFEIIRQINGEGGEMLQGLNLQEIHTNCAEQRMAEHKPEVGTIWDDHDGLLAGEEPEINGDNGRYDDEAARHLVHQHGTAADSHADLLVADGIEGADS